VADVLNFILFGVILSPMISATNGVSGLWLTGMAPQQALPSIWVCWWLGDAMGVLIVAPCLLTWFRPSAVRFRSGIQWKPTASLEFLSLLITLGALGGLTYSDALPSDLAKPLSYAVFPVIIWAALRFEQRGVTTIAFLCTAFAVWGTANGRGPFFQSSLTLSLGYLHAFMAVVTITGLILAVVIGERRRAEQAHADSADRLRLAVKSSNVGLWDWNLKTDEVIFSPEWKRQLGYEPHEITNNFFEWQNRCHPDDVQRAWEHVQRYLKGETAAFEIEFRLQHRDGTWKWIYAKAQKLDDNQGKPLRLIGCHVDISERKRFEEAKSQSEARFRGYFELGLIGMAITSPEKGWLEFNDKLCQILGYPRDVLCQMTWTELTHPDDLEADVGWFNRVLAGEIDGYSMDKRFIRGDGTITFATIAARAVRGFDGRIDHFIALVHDISERRLLEEQLRQSQKMEAIGQLAGGAAHDFNNYLTVITGYCDLLLARLPSSDPNRPAIQTMFSASERAASLTNQLLAFSRQTILQPCVVNLNATVKEAEPLLRGMAGEHVRLILNLNPSIRQIFVDPGQLTQVLVNLVVNARDAMPNGGQLTISTDVASEGQLQLLDRATVSHCAAAVRLSVADTGNGMTPEVAQRVFEPFFTTKGIGKGTGLGLAMVYGIVKQSDGHIQVHSEPGHGTEFDLVFPAVDGEAMSRTEADATSLISPGNGMGTERILAVEDKASVRDLTVRILTSHGYTVVAAEDGLQALERFAEADEEFDMLLTDVVMPAMSGPALAEILVGKKPSLKVLFVTGYTDDVAVRNKLQESRRSCLQKPFTPTTLIQQVRAILDADMQ
jgi:PAS domain S-box-containing protein